MVNLKLNKHAPLKKKFLILILYRLIIITKKMRKKKHKKANTKTKQNKPKQNHTLVKNFCHQYDLFRRLTHYKEIHQMCFLALKY